MVYKWNKYAYPISADIVGKHFEKIEKEYGKLDRKIVLDSARSEKSPIHSLFEWDDSIAGEKYRLQQATNLIINLDVEVQTEKKPIICRAFVNVTDEKKGTFINVETAFKAEETREVVLDRALRELKAFENKYKNLKEFSELFDLIESLFEKVG